MPFKHNPSRRHRIPRARYRVTNWATTRRDCVGGVIWRSGLRKQRWLGWRASRRSTPGGQPRHSELAIKLVLTLRLVFHLALRQAEGFARSVLQLLGLGQCRCRTIPP